jgi:hypothetical protein
VKRTFAIVVAAAASLGLAPGAAKAATVSVSPQNACYHSAQKIGFGGAGFSPFGAVTVTSDGSQIGVLQTDGTGAFTGVLTVGQAKGQKVKSYAATDQANPAVTAAVNLKVSALDVSVRPRSGRPGRRLRIRARGFAGSRNLYAHVLRRRFRRTVRLGRLKGDCGTLRKRKRMFSSATRSGTYTVQFDGSRRYSRKTKVRVRFRVFVFHKLRRSSATGAGASWVRLP